MIFGTRINFGGYLNALTIRLACGA